MKFVYFHLMPYDRLPADFSEQYRSSWVDLPARAVDSQRVSVLYNDYLDTLEYASAAGFDAIGVNEHHSSAFGLDPNPSMMATVLARSTRDSAILVMGSSIPLYNPPIRVAEELAVVDVMSGGRLIAGFPVGSSQDANFAYGLPPVTTRDRFNEGYELVMKAWQAEGPFTFNGKYTKLRYANSLPKPIQTPHPPLWTPGSGSVETFEFAAKNDMPYCFLSFFGVDFATKNFQKYWQTVEDSGIDDNPYRAGMVQMVAVADTDEEAERLYAPHVEYFFRRGFSLYPGFTEAPGYKSVQSLQSVLPPKGGQTTSRADSFGAARKYEWKDFVEKGIVIAGSPETVRERLLEAGRRNRIGNWITLMQFGDMPVELAKHNIDLFSSKVAPHLGQEWSEYDHKWWPSGAVDKKKQLPLKVSA